jgi:seryl-tRNA synthetase
MKFTEDQLISYGIYPMRSEAGAAGKDTRGLIVSTISRVFELVKFQGLKIRGSIKAQSQEEILNDWDWLDGSSLFR